MDLFNFLALLVGHELCKLGVRSRINARFMMDNGRIFIADVSKGKLGADKSNLLGAMLVTQFQLDEECKNDPVKRAKRHAIVDALMRENL
jgi:hypothetical protein